MRRSRACSRHRRRSPTECSERQDVRVTRPDALQRDSAVPLYVQLEEILRAKIAAGEWQTDQRVPSENELNKMYGLSRMTARAVLTNLVNDGLLFRVPGKGTFLAPTKIDAVSPAYRGVREQLEAMGYETSTELLSVSL